MLKDDVVVLVHKNAQLVVVLQLFKELGIVNHLELCSVFIKLDTSGGYRSSRSFVNTTRESRKEWLILKEPPCMFI